MNNKLIAMLICYYGKFPWYFSYFLHSCKYNPTIDFFLITDQSLNTVSLPENVRVVYKPICELNDIAAEKLGFDVNLSLANTYKISEFKPTLGLLFGDLIEGYEFWGQCDIDVIFGDIRTFITDDILDSHDLISVRPDWIPGCFFLYRNTPKMNTLFMRSKDYKKALTTEEYFNFDETNFRHNEFKSGKTYLEVKSEIESMLHVVQKAEAECCIKPFYDFFMIEGLSGKLKWENGRMFYKNRFEVLLYHMMYLKNIYIPPKPINYIPNTFTISPTRIYHRANFKTTANEV